MDKTVEMVAEIDEQEAQRIELEIERGELKKLKMQLREEQAFLQARQSESYANPVIDDHWKYANYLQLLIELQKVGHDCHKEINDTLKELHGIIFKTTQT